MTKNLTSTLTRRRQEAASSDLQCDSTTQNEGSDLSPATLPLPLLCQKNGLWLRLPLSSGRQRRILSWQKAHSGMGGTKRGDTRHRQVLPMVGEPQLLQGYREGCCSLHVAPGTLLCRRTSWAPAVHTSLHCPLPWAPPVELGSHLQGF